MCTAIDPGTFINNSDPGQVDPEPGQHWPSSLPVWALCLSKSIITVINSQSPRGQNVCESIVENTCRALLLKAPDPIQNSTSIIKLPLWPVLHYGWIKAERISSEGFHLHNYIVVLRFFKQKRKNWLKEAWTCLLSQFSFLEDLNLLRVPISWKISTSLTCSVCSRPFKLRHLEMMLTWKMMCNRINVLTQNECHKNHMFEYVWTESNIFAKVPKFDQCFSAYTEPWMFVRLQRKKSVFGPVLFVMF